MAMLAGQLPVADSAKEASSTESCEGHRCYRRGAENGRDAHQRQELRPGICSYSNWTLFFNFLKSMLLENLLPRFSTNIKFHHWTQCEELVVFNNFRYQEV